MKHCRTVYTCLFALLGILLLGTGGLYAQSGGADRGRGPVVHTRFLSDTILLGDHFFLELDIDKDVAQEIQLPQFEKNQLTPQIEVLGIDGIDTLSREGRRINLRITYRLTSFDEGTHAVGGFPVVWTTGVPQNQGQANAAPVAGDTVLAPEQMRLTVTTFDIDTTKQQIFDIKRPMNTPLIFAEVKGMVFWGVGIAILLAGIIYLIIWYVRRRRGLTGPRRVIPPHVLAIRALEKLHSRKLWQNGRHKEYYSTMADIVRVYMERRYDIPAMEMTTDQILAAVREVNDEHLREKLRELFGLADLVKFAKMAPGPEDNEQAYFDAYFYVEETKEIADPSEIPLVDKTDIRHDQPDEATDDQPDQQITHDENQ